MIKTGRYGDNINIHTYIYLKSGTFSYTWNNKIC